MIKKVIAIVMSVLLCCSLMVPAFAEDSEGGSGLGLDLGSIDVSSILSSDIMQQIMQNEDVIDLTNVILELAIKYNAESLQAMGQEEAEKFVSSTVETISDAIMIFVGNSDLIFTYDPVKVMGNLFDLDTGSADSSTGSSDAEKDPNELVFGKGDVDGDGKVSAADARRILRRAAKLVVFTMAEESRADVDNDRKITANDARIVLRVAAGLDSFDNYSK